MYLGLPILNMQFSLIKTKKSKVPINLLSCNNKKIKEYIFKDKRNTLKFRYTSIGEIFLALKHYKIHKKYFI